MSVIFGFPQVGETGSAAQSDQSQVQPLSVPTSAGFHKASVCDHSVFVPADLVPNTSLICDLRHATQFVIDPCAFNLALARQHHLTVSVLPVIVE